MPFRGDRTGNDSGEGPRSGPGGEPSSVTAGRLGRWGPGPRALGLLFLLAAGCTTLPVRSPQTRQGQAPETASKTDGDIKKTDFRAKVGPGQETNVHLDMGRIYQTQGNLDAAIVEYQKAIDSSTLPHRHLGGSRAIQEQQSLAHRRMATALDQLGQFGQAEVHYRKALALSPDNPKVWNDAGYSYFIQSRWADAERCLKTAMKLDPTNPRYGLNLGLALAGAGKTEEALVALTRASGPASAHANLGYILASHGQHDAARRHYLEALRLQPDFLAARNALAQLDVDANRAAPTAVASSTPAPARITIMNTDGALNRTAIR